MHLVEGTANLVFHGPCSTRGGSFTESPARAGKASSYVGGSNASSSTLGIGTSGGEIMSELMVSGRFQVVQYKLTTEQR